MKCTSKEQNTCRVEKMGCEGCAYNSIDKEAICKELVQIESRLTELSRQNRLKYYITTDSVYDSNGTTYQKVTIDALTELK